MIPTVLKSLEGRRLSRIQPSWATQAGKNVLATQLPQFENPWTQIAAAFGQGVLGSAIQSYGQGKDAEALQAYDQQTALDLAEATAETDPMKRAAILREKGLGDVAQVFDVAQMMTEAERAEKLQDPEYLLKEKQFKSDVGFKNQELGLRRQQLAASQADATVRTQLALAQELARAKEIELQQIAETKKVSREGASKIREVVLDAKKDPAVKLFSDVNGKYGRMEPLVVAAREARLRGDTAAEAAAMHKVQEEFVKISGEALQSEDTARFASSVGLYDQFDVLMQRMSGKGGNLTLDQAQSLVDTMGVIRQASLDIAQEATKPYKAMVDEIETLYPETSTKPYALILPTGEKVNAAALTAGGKSLANQAAVATPTPMPTIAPTTTPSTTGTVSEMQNLQRFKNYANRVGQGISSLLTGR